MDTQQLSHIVIRPAGVWDSRSPMNDYLIRRRRIMRTYNALGLSIHCLTVEAKAAGARSAKKWLKVGEGNKQAGVHWREYRRTLPRESPDPDDLPSVDVETFVDHLGDAIYHIRRDAIVAQAGTFETYTQCWALNVLLAKLENGERLTPAHCHLLQSFSPLSKTDELPTVPRILQSMPEIADALTKMPAFNIRAAVSSTSGNADGSATALDAIRFWRAARNNIVHRGGVVTGRFFRRHLSFIRELNDHYSYMERLVVGGGFKFYDDTVRAMSAVHYKVAMRMNEHLEAVSRGRRGHVHAPATKQDDVFMKGEARSPPLLLHGDHESSLNWITDSSYRRAAILRHSAQS